MKVLVTGGGGFIGSNLCRTLLKKNIEVRILDNFSTGRMANLTPIKKQVEIIKGDLQDLTVVRKSAKGCRYIFHQGALPSVPRSVRDPIGTNLVNITGTLNILIAARDMNIQRVIYASSSSVYGDTKILPKDESIPPRPLSPYALQKLTGESYCRLFWKLYGLETICLRYFNVFGPNQDPKSEYAAVIPKFITQFLHGKPPLIYGDGKQSRDFTYVDNVVNANLLACRSKKGAGEIMNIACGERITLLELIHQLNDIFQSKIKPIHQAARIGDVKHSMADITLAKKIIGFKPTIKFISGLRKTVEWFLENNPTHT